MDFRRIIIIITTFSGYFLFAGCNTDQKTKQDATFYIELVNFTGDSVKLADSLKKTVSGKLFWKASYYKNGKLQIVPVEYLTDNDSSLHYFKNLADSDVRIANGTRKIRVEYGGKFTRDSISYSLQKFTYNNEQWKKTSDMGFIKATNTYFRAKEFAIDQYAAQIVNDVILYSYN